MWPREEWARQTEGLQRERAEKYLERHRPHVDRLLMFKPLGREPSYAPTGSDAVHPELWTAAHWRWWLAKRERS